MTHDEEFQDGRDEAVSRSLDRMGMVEPPADLKSNVLRAIDARRPAPVRMGWIEGLRESFRRRPLLGAVYPFAAGAAVAAIVLTLLSGGGRFDRTSMLSGAMAPGSGDAGDVGARVDDQRYEVNRANVHLTAVRSGDDVRASVEARSPGDVAITLKFDPRRFRPVTFTQDREWEGSLECGPGWLKIQQRGDVNVQFRFDDLGAGDAPIQVTIEADGGSVRGVLQTNPV